MAKMLFSPIKSTEVEPLAMDHIPFSGYKYLMWCGKVIYRRSRPEFGTLTDEDKNHESLHLDQAIDKGSWVKYYLSYVWNWIKHYPLFTRKNGAYYLNKYEVEAYAKDKDLEYRKRRNKNAVENFKIKREEFLKHNSIYEYKKYIREKFINL